MRKFIVFIIVAAFLFSVPGCGQARVKEDVSGDKLKVVTTIFAPFDFVRVIAGDAAEASMLLPPGSESHSFEPSPQDIIRIQNCDVFIYAGGDSDSWVRDVLASMDMSGKMVVTLMDCVPVVAEEIVEGMQDDHEHDEHDVHEGEEHDEHAADEHVWTSPKNAMLIVEKISAALCAADEENADIYKQNMTAYLTELERLDVSFQKAVDGAARRTIVFGDRFPFRYLADAYGLSYFAAFPGCSTETEASAATVAFLVDKIRDEGIPVVFHVELSNQRMADVISESTGAKVLLLHACHNVSKAEFESGVTYLDLMNQNVENLKEALL